MFDNLIEQLSKMESYEQDSENMMESACNSSYKVKAMAISEQISEDEILAGDKEITTPQEEKKLLKLIDLIPDEDDDAVKKIEDAVEHVIPVDIMNHSVSDVYTESGDIFTEFSL